MSCLPHLRTSIFGQTVLLPVDKDLDRRYLETALLSVLAQCMQQCHQLVSIHVRHMCGFKCDSGRTFESSHCTLIVTFVFGVSMSVDRAVVDYWLKELMPTFTQVRCQHYSLIAGSQYYSLHVYTKDGQEAKHMIALLLVNDVRNLGDMRHTDPPQEWMWAERLSPDLLEHLQTLHARAQQCCDLVAPIAKRRARQSSRHAPSPLVRTVQLSTFF